MCFFPQTFVHILQEPFGNVPQLLFRQDERLQVLIDLRRSKGAALEKSFRAENPLSVHSAPSFNAETSERLEAGFVLSTSREHVLAVCSFTTSRSDVPAQSSRTR